MIRRDHDPLTGGGHSPALTRAQTLDHRLVYRCLDQESEPARLSSRRSLTRMARQGRFDAHTPDADRLLRPGFVDKTHLRRVWDQKGCVQQPPSVSLMASGMGVGVRSASARMSAWPLGWDWASLLGSVMRCCVGWDRLGVEVGAWAMISPAG